MFLATRLPRLERAGVERTTDWLRRVTEEDRTVRLLLLLRDERAPRCDERLTWRLLERLGLVAREALRAERERLTIWPRCDC